ncbi:hypothetical protein ABUE34_07105 [Kozakia baliensis]|uniref:aspartyl protease family protein n=1 Tax=Kozakia baliensis TaxID=153496 RepID=UPI00345BD909
MTRRAYGLALLLLAGCDTHMSGGRMDFTPVPQKAENATSFVPPPYPFDIEAETRMPAHCIHHILAANLISRGGSPAVPVTVDSEKGIGFLSPSEDDIGVFNDNDDHLDDLPDISVEKVTTVSGTQETFITRLKQLTFAQGHVEKVRAAKLGQMGDDRKSDKRPLAILGFDILGNYNVLLDIPAKRLILFIADSTPDCPSLSEVVGGKTFQTPLMNGLSGADNLVTVMLDGKLIGMHLEPSSNLSVISRKDALGSGLTEAELEQGDRTNTLNGETLVGYRYAYRAINIGNWHGGAFSVNVEPVNYNLLGLDFFRHRRVLMAFPSGMVYFGDEQPDSEIETHTRGLSPLASHIAHSHVRL